MWRNGGRFSPNQKVISAEEKKYVCNRKRVRGPSAFEKRSKVDSGRMRRCCRFIAAFLCGVRWVCPDVVQLEQHSQRELERRKQLGGRHRAGCRSERQRQPRIQLRGPLHVER